MKIKFNSTEEGMFLKEFISIKFFQEKKKSKIKLTSKGYEIILYY